MSSNILVSIIIPVYNTEDFISETLQSCFDQSYKKIEVIIVNDGSTDNSEEIINQFQDPRIQYYKIRNSGACEARNFGIKKAKGKLIQFLDADDVLDKDKLYEQVLLYEQFGDDFIYSAKMGQINYGIRSIQPEYDLYEKDFTPQEYFETVLNQFGKYLTTGIWLTPAKIVSSTSGWDKEASSNDDGEYLMRLLLESKGIVYAKKSLFYYRRDNGASISRDRSRKAHETMLYAYLSYSKHFLLFFDLKIGKKLAWKALSVYYCSFYSSHTDLSKSCLLEIRKIGYSRPFAHGGDTFKKVAHYIGVYNALRCYKIKDTLIKKIGR